MQFPAGPHFSNAFYITAVGTVSAIFSLVGIFTYNKIMYAWKYRTLLALTNVIFMAVNLVSAMVYVGCQGGLQPAATGVLVYAGLDDSQPNLVCLPPHR